MDEAARRDWLKVAWDALRDLPGDLLRIGAEKARQVADHPAKIIPAIMGEVESLLRERRRSIAADRERQARISENRQIGSRSCTGEEAERILAEEGLLAAVRGNEAPKVERGPLRKPTRQDYLEMGVDPAVLDSLMAGQQAA